MIKKVGNYGLSSIHFLALLLVFVSCTGSEKHEEKIQKVAEAPLPILKETNGVKQLYVEGSPFIILGGELLNSSASSIEHMEPVWSNAKAHNVNTLLLPITWQQTEPQEGEYDFSVVDNHIEMATQHDLHLILLWFGSWKNGVSHYTPHWVKTDLERFPRMRYRNQKVAPVISNFSQNCLEADKRAYLKFMERVAQVDTSSTVLMVQIENEVGLLGDSRDFSTEATALFKAEVPAELIGHIKENVDQIKPIIREAYLNNGSKTAGTWEEVFGQSKTTDEMFMAWNYATYINELAKAGKEVHNIPTLVNAWAASRQGQPGSWPSGGPNYRMLDIWNAGAPAIDLFAIDNYSDEGFDRKCKDFMHQGNPLFIPEACAIWLGDTISAAAKAFYTIGHHNAICFSPFGIDHEVYHENHPVRSAYNTLDNLMPLIVDAQVEGKVNAFMEYDSSSPSSFVLGDYRFTAAYNLKKEPHIKGFGMVIQTASDEFIIAGNAFNLKYESINADKPYSQLLSVEEGSFLDGEWLSRRVLNGDEFGLKFPAKPYGLTENVVLGEIAIHRVKMSNHSE